MTLFYNLCGILFFLMAFVVFYTYVGYGIVAWILVKVLRSNDVPAVTQSDYYPNVTMIIPAYNERDYLTQKLQNCLAQDYPAQNLHLLFVVEGSTDGSEEYLEEQKKTLPNLSIISGLERMGKIAAMNKAMHGVETPITIFTDANTQLNPEAVSRIVKRFECADVGAVTGEKRIQLQGQEAAAGSGEGLYWRYESFLKKLDAQLHTIVGAAGELFSIRTELYEPVEADTLLDDFMISLRIASRGYRVDYAPDAYALERPSESVREEKKRKVRIATGGFQSIQRLTHLLNPFKYGWLSFQYVSHRVLRWAVTPFCLPLLFLLNCLMLTKPAAHDSNFLSGQFWIVVLGIQVIFYLIAGIGYVLENRHTRFKLTFIPFYFVFMNWCVLAGFARFCNGNLSGIWEKAGRAA